MEAVDFLNNFGSTLDSMRSPMFLICISLLTLSVIASVGAFLRDLLTK